MIYKLNRLFSGHDAKSMFLKNRSQKVSIKRRVQNFRCTMKQGQGDLFNELEGNLQYLLTIHIFLYIFHKGSSTETCYEKQYKCVMRTQ